MLSHLLIGNYPGLETGILPLLNDVTLTEMFTNYIYRTVALGTAIIGGCSGAIGCLLYLRKQSLLSDVVGHSAIAGVMAAFAVATVFLNIDGRSMLVLTIGALISSLVSVLMTEWITRHSKLSQDAAMSICLALFYGLGITGLHLITHSTLPNRGGIKDYMFGKATSLSDDDVHVMFLLALGVIIVVMVLWKEIKLFIFDPVLAATSGFKSSILTPILLTCATISIVIGVKAVGLILMVAFAIMPAASARQWTKRLSTMVVLAAFIGMTCALMGTYISIRIGKVPTGPVIVILLFLVFVISMIAPPERSVLRRVIKRNQIRGRLNRDLAAVAQNASQESSAKTNQSGNAN
ncbi:metal ABC transporter permease [Actinomycetaceae bacterium TAE3-ERU4]|nr:metal ABC transporter permease [Actinomycetaceae bacterium TAE3-ERU4]